MAAITTDAATAREKLHDIIDEIEDVRVINLYEFLKDEDRHLMISFIPVK